jgi:hypothetical protein
MKKFLVSGFKMFPDRGRIVRRQGQELLDGRPFKEISGLNHLHAHSDMKSISGAIQFLFVVLGGQKIEVFGLKSAFGGGFPKSGFAKEQ